MDLASILVAKMEKQSALYLKMKNVMAKTSIAVITRRWTKNGKAKISDRGIQILF